MSFGRYNAFASVRDLTYCDIHGGFIEKNGRPIVSSDPMLGLDTWITRL